MTTSPPTANNPAGNPAGASLPAEAQDEAITICHELLRIDSSNYGDGSGPGERTAAEYVAGLLAEAGIEPQVFESDPKRTSLVARIPGRDGGRPALLLHGHLDVVPAQADDWEVHPFSGEERDGCLWGRGAVDMKDMDAMLLAVLRGQARAGVRPPRDLVIAFTADEEAGGRRGAHWLVDEHADLFDGVTEAVSEVGGYSLDLAGRRAYLLQAAEKGILWLKLTARGRAGHGSQVNDDNAVTRLSAALARIGEYRWPAGMPDSVRDFLDGAGELLGEPLRDGDVVDGERLHRRLGTAARWVEATLHNTANPTVLDAGYKHNVIPGRATALVDCRFLPGREDELMDTVRELAGPGIEIEVIHRDVALEWPFDAPLVNVMRDALLAEDPDATVLPYCLAGGTDNKAFSRLDIAGYGFAPLRLPADLDFAGMFHGVDERVPLDALRFGVRALDRFIRSC